MQQIMSQLLSSAVYSRAETDIVRLRAANPTNEFPIIKRALETKNVIVYQILIGRINGLSAASAGILILEGVSSSVSKYVDHTTVMTKAGPAAGSRPVHTMTYNQELFTKIFLSNDRKKFRGLDFLLISAEIKSAREQVPLQKLEVEGGMFRSAETIPLLRYFSHYLDAFEFDFGGAGSWEDAMTRLEEFRSNGLSLPGAGMDEHFGTCSSTFGILLDELFDALSHFTQAKEASDVLQALSRRVYETGGAFDQHVNYTKKVAASLNEIIYFHPSIGAALMQTAGASSSSGAGGGNDAKADDPHPDGSPIKGEAKYKWVSGHLLFGKGQGGPKYAVNLIWKEIEKVDSSLSKKNFCIVHFLSTTNACTNPKHKTGGYHKVSDALKKIRDDFEHKPFRVDSKAKAAK